MSILHPIRHLLAHLLDDTAHRRTGEILVAG